EVIAEPTSWGPRDAPRDAIAVPRVTRTGAADTEKRTGECFESKDAGRTVRRSAASAASSLRLARPQPDSHALSRCTWAREWRVLVHWAIRPARFRPSSL